MNAAHHIKAFFVNHPLVGMITSLLGGLQAFIETTTPLFQFAAMIIALAIGIYTLLLKRREWNKKDK